MLSVALRGSGLPSRPALPPGRPRLGPALQVRLSHGLQLHSARVQGESCSCKLKRMAAVFTLQLYWYMERVFHDTLKLTRRPDRGAATSLMAYS